MLYYIIVLLQIVEERFVYIGEFLLLRQVLVTPDEEIRSEEFGENIIEYLLGVVHLLARLDRYPRYHVDKLE